MAPLLEVNHIQTYIGQYRILDGVSLQVEQGSITALLGRNGAGKTTTLKSILGLTPPRAGEIRFAGVPINGRRTFQIAQSGIGYVPEHRAIFRDLTVLENLTLAERKRGDLRRSGDLIFGLFPRLHERLQQQGGTLSGGEQQMLAIARALVPDNRLLLIDEPSEGLAPVIIEQMMAAIQQLSAYTTVLLVEQNFRMASAISQRYYIVDDGRTVHTGAMAALRDNKPLVQTYLGAA
ncbi:MAG: ABC transporter ATP-binding protein [Chloroflexota bacterium]|nr:ABC transporter ATP-binding protein [Chloroflexota bacterium]